MDYIAMGFFKNLSFFPILLHSLRPAAQVLYSRLWLLLLYCHRI